MEELEDVVTPTLPEVLHPHLPVWRPGVEEPFVWEEGVDEVLEFVAPDL